MLMSDLDNCFSSFLIHSLKEIGVNSLEIYGKYIPSTTWFCSLRNITKHKLQSPSYQKTSPKQENGWSAHAYSLWALHFISSAQARKKMPTQCALNSSIKWQSNSCEQHGPLLRFKVSSFTPHIVEGQKILNHKSNNQQCPKTSKSGFKMKIKASGWELSVGGSTQTGWKSSRSLNLKGFLFKQKQKSCDQNPNTNVSQEQPTENAKACKKIMFQRTLRVVPNLVQVRAAQYF